MRRKRINNIWMAFCSSMLILASCNSDALSDKPEGVEPLGDGFYVSLELDGQKPRIVGRAETPDELPDLDEDVIERADLFVVDATGAIVLYHKEDPCASSPIKIEAGDWKTTMEAENCTIYALANYKGEEKLENIKTLDNLLKLEDSDDEIYKWVGMNDGSCTEKTFLMDGKYSFVNESTTEGQYVVTVPMKRAAAKIQVNVTLSEEFSKNYIPNDFKMYLHNYVTNTYAWSDAGMLSDANRTFASMPTDGDTDNGFSNALCDDYTPDEIKVGSLRFYTYVNTWELSAANETVLLIDIPGSYDGTPHSHNYYKIPLIIGEGERTLQRNHFYQIEAIVDMLGASKIDDVKTLEKANYQIANWETETISVKNEDVAYLTLSENVIDIRNVSEYSELEFYSSSPIKSVELVSGDEALASGQIDYKYPGPTTETSIPSVYFVNKNNERVEVTDVQVKLSYTEGNTGTITIESPDPMNVTKRYITLKITNNEDIVKYVVVVQSPLEYIQPIAGYYSYRDDFLSSSNATPSNSPCTWESTFTTNNDTDPTTISNAFFTSKVVDGGKVYKYSAFKRTGNRPYTWSSNHEITEYTLQNNMMYFVTITATDDSYKIAKPIVYEKDFGNGEKLFVTDESDENNKLVSPLFMLASQLGAVAPTKIGGWTNAQKHCAYYVETYQKDGETQKLDDWRVPTKAELEIIKKYQRSTPDVMDEVLSGQYYYAADGSAFYAAGSSTNSGPEATPSLRCIRDVKPGEFAN